MPAQLFYSYSHRDEKLRDRLEVFLSALKDQRLISEWHDRKITAGNEWNHEIDDRLKSARIILLLISADFIASPYCRDFELAVAMERHDTGEARVIPVILRPCDWMTSRFARLQVLPRDGKPVTLWKNRDQAFLDIVEGIRKALQELCSSGSSAQITTLLVGSAREQPRSPDGFIGRETDLKELMKAVKTDRVTICSIQGMGGIGKTALALKFAESLASTYPGGQFYVDLRGDTKNPVSARDAMAHVIRTYDPAAQLPAEETAVSALYRSILSKKKTLLIMDNARDELQIDPLIPPPRCLLIVTSRKRLGLPGAWEKSLDVLQPRYARDLLRRIASRRISEKTASELAELCGNLPLALRAVGSALKVREDLTPAAYARKLKDSPLNLTTVDASLQASYDLLPPELQRRFAAASVFPDTFDANACAAVWRVKQEDASDSLGNLIQYSLIGFSPSAKRYRLHGLVRPFASARLQPEQLEVFQELHASYYCEFLDRLEKLYLRGNKSVTRALDLFDLEWSNIKTGQHWSYLHSANNKTAAALCIRYPLAAKHCFFLRQHPRERITWLRPALTAARRSNDSANEARVLSGLGLAYYSLGDYDLAIDYHERHLSIARELADQSSEMHALGNLGLAYYDLGKNTRAIEYYKQCLKLAQKTRNKRIEANALSGLGLAYFALKKFKLALECHNAHLRIARKIGDLQAQAAGLGNLGLYYSGLGKYDLALKSYQESLKIARDLRDSLFEAHGYWNISRTYERLKRFHEAIDHAEKALMIYTQLESPEAKEVRETLAKWRKKRPESAVANPRAPAG